VVKSTGQMCWWNWYLRGTGCSARVVTGKKERWIIQQHNAPAHSAKETKEEIVRLMGGEKSRVELDWPPMSPDLSWIENVWGLAERELAKERQSIKTISELEKSVEKILKGIRIEVLENLVKSMPARLRKVIEGGGTPH
jgi:hypothetical protein